MAVKRAAALLSNPKLEDKGSESTNQHEGPRKRLIYVPKRRKAKTRYLSLLAE
jgi:hypothetical protein